MFDALVEWMGYPLYTTMYTGEAPPRSGLGHAAIVPYDGYPTLEGGRLLIGVQNDRGWVALTREVLERPELADDPRYATNVARVAHRAEVDALVADATRALPAAELAARLDAAGIPERCAQRGRTGGPASSARRPATGGVRSARPVDRSVRCCPRSRSTASRPGWTRSPLWVSTPTRSCASSATRRRPLPNCAPQAPSAEAAAVRRGWNTHERSRTNRTMVASRFAATSTITSTARWGCADNRMHDREGAAREAEADPEHHEPFELAARALARTA